MNPEEWSGIGHAFSAISDARRVTVFPRLWKHLQQSAPARLLDYGGGDGLFALEALRWGGQTAVVYDPAPAMLELARRNAAAERRMQVVESTCQLKEGEFDVVVMNAVWMCLATEEQCVEVLSEIRRLLKPGGEFLASVTHPCFRDRRFATYQTDFPMGRYLEDGASFGVTMSDGEREVRFNDTHWSLSAMTRQMQRAGLQLAGLEELPDMTAGGGEGSPWLLLFGRRGKPF
ncbi:MAG TPA: class I SAM-dependent methyltransferase [Verrucomicrobiota bacterium]|nr:hypothetical protein [Verrucomicrobiales bacterium]HRI13609.1 class I SAM-dependent methyltransferase [Verrucomicrobiota bacterium]